jgi:small-conductance mechanosensitive channel
LFGEEKRPVAVLRDFVQANWQDALIPASVFLASLIVLLWLRRRIEARLGKWLDRTGWPGNNALARLLRGPSVFWALLISGYLGLQVSALSQDWTVPLGRGIGSVFILSVAFTLVQLVNSFFPVYSARLNLPAPAARTVSIIVSLVVFAVALLMVLDIWGAPAAPILLAVGIGALAILLALRDVLPSLFASLQINATGQIKVGDYIKLETGEEGYVVDIGWTSTQLRALDESLVLLPNSKLARAIVTNYGRPLSQAQEPFRFYSRVHLKELTGLKAHNLHELAEVLGKAPEGVVYYHTHHFLEEHHYLTPEPPNDFAAWASDVMGDQELGEKLAAVDTFQFPTLGLLRERLTAIIREHLAGHQNHAAAPEGAEFHFVKSVSFITPTSYVAHNLRELAEILKRLPLGSLYFHVFESRLRLGRSTDDFSAWVAQSLGDQELAAAIARLDPYNYTLEGLRSALTQVIETRIN